MLEALPGVPTTSTTLNGWDTELAEPFDLILRLPTTFTAPDRSAAFSAVDRSGKYWLVRESLERLWIYGQRVPNSKLTRHYFQMQWGLQRTRIHRAIVCLAELMRDRKRSGELTLDISGFKKEIAALRSSLALTAPGGGAGFLTATQVQALKYICLNVGLGSEVRVYFHQEIELRSRIGGLFLPKPLPEALSSIPDALEVALHNGNLFDLRPPCLQIPPIESSGSPVEQMKAMNRLLETGLSDEVVRTLDDYIATFPG